VVVPAGWKELEISELCVPQKSRIDPRVSGGGDICVELEHIAGGSGQLLGVTNTSGTSSLKTKFEPGDVLFGKLRAYLRKYWLAEFAGVCSTEIWALSANRTEAVPGFLAQIVRTEDFIEAASLSYGTHMPRSDWAIVSKLIVSVPPLKEQEAIAEALSDADASIESLDALIAKKRDVQQATMQQLLTGRTRLSGFSDTWKVEPLDGHVSMLKGKGLSRSKLSDSGKFQALLYGELFTVYGRVIRSVNSRTDSDEGIASLFGDVLMPGSTTTTGEDLATASALLQNDVRIGGDVNIIRPDLKVIDPSWLAYRITNCHRRDVGSITQGITIHHLYGREIASLLIPFPALDEQKAIVEILTKMNDELEALNEQVLKLRMLKEGMMQDLLTGKVRLV
jgi:type I restriction enzyme S subunit